MGQHTISGTFSPAQDYKWLIAHYLEPGKQTFAAHTAIENGEFILKLPEDSPTGVYRMVYALPREEYYFDVIVNGKEEVQLHFDENEGVRFSTSGENDIFNSYFGAMYELENQLVQYYVQDKKDKEDLQRLLKKMGSVQTDYEKRSEGLLTNHFIQANKPYIPSVNESVLDYIGHKKANYFKALDLKNPILQASGFLTDKLANYVFTALPPRTMDAMETQKVIQENLVVLNTQMREVSAEYKFHTYYTLWKKAVSLGYDTVADTLYETYLNPLAQQTNNTGVIEEIQAFNRLELGAVAPEISWNKDNTSQMLSGLSGADHYVLVFWSSSCSHCLQELPQLHKELKGKQNLKVLAIGLEDEENVWKSESSQMDTFEHVLALGKWENEYAKLYNIQSTPTYFILDSEKRILAKPEDSQEVLEFLEGT